MHEQLKFGSHILVNKADLLTDEDKNIVLEEVKTINDHAKMYETKYCNISLKDIEEAEFQMMRNMRHYTLNSIYIYKR